MTTHNSISQFRLLAFGVRTLWYLSKPSQLKGGMIPKAAICKALGLPKARQLDVAVTKLAKAGWVIARTGPGGGAMITEAGLKASAWDLLEWAMEPESLFAFWMYRNQYQTKGWGTFVVQMDAIEKEKVEE